ncbi:MAG: ribosomal-processing cysteine protease Prp [Firmicutes bacterium]|nr:ribosomal-processing cysteine protease Prp [Bacillota bacterium]MCL1953341.1 ribosomal-processing cysteine protease Prp [Bacillota bacterium]
MTVVEVTRKDRHIVSVNCLGHADFDVYGYDIVCAALSSIIQTTALGLMQVLGLDISLTSDSTIASMSFVLPELSEQKRIHADILLDTMLLGIDNISDTYSDFVQLQVKDK